MNMPITEATSRPTPRPTPVLPKEHRTGSEDSRALGKHIVDEALTTAADNYPFEWCLVADQPHNIIAGQQSAVAAMTVHEVMSENFLG